MNDTFVAIYKVRPANPGALAAMKQALAELANLPPAPSWFRLMNTEGFAFFAWRRKRFPGSNHGNCSACRAMWSRRLQKVKPR